MFPMPKDPTSMRRLCLLLVAVLLLCGATARQPKRDPATGRIRILYIGDPVPGSPFPTFMRDPITDVTPVIASGFNFPEETIRRYMRQYMPRTLRRLYENYDVVIISDAGKRFFTSKHMAWFRDSVVDHGVALVMIGGFETFGGNIGLGSWGDTAVQEVLPVTCIENGWEDKAGYLTVRDWDHPLIKSLPFSKIGRYGVFYGCNIVKERQGAIVIADYRVASPRRTHPLLCYWDVGNGSSFAMMADWTPAGGTDFMRWPYYGDYCLNVVTYSAGGRLPDDPTLVYEARSLMATFGQLRETLESLIEFASKFGAKMAPVEKMIGAAEEIKEQAEKHYIHGEIEQSIESYKRAIRQLEDASDKAYKLRTQAMLWVFVTEWLVVASTGMLCGFFLWTVMVKRKMYREVEQTKLRPA